VDQVSRAAQVIEVSPEFFREYGWSAIDLPPIDWYVKGPRGGMYQAIGERTRQLVKDWDGHWYVKDESESLRYVRPGTQRHREAKEQVR